MNADACYTQGKKLMQQQGFSFTVQLFVHTLQGPSTSKGVSAVYCIFSVLTGPVMPGCTILCNYSLTCLQLKLSDVQDCYQDFGLWMRTCIAEQLAATPPGDYCFLSCPL